MKWRKKILVGIMLAGLTVLVLGLIGVFSPRVKPPPEDDAGDLAAGTENATEVNTEDFEAKGKNWRLTAPFARMDADRNASLTDPELTIWRTREGKDGEPPEDAKEREELKALVGED